MIEKYIDETGEKKDLEKFANLTYLLDIWMNNIEKGTKIADFFKNRGYNSIGVFYSVKITYFDSIFIRTHTSFVHM